MSTENELYEIEVVDGQLVGHGYGQLEATAAERLPGLTGQAAVQTAMAAATGFVAGAATIALLRRYGQARLERAAGPPLLDRVGGRTYVVTVRRLG